MDEEALEKFKKEIQAIPRDEDQPDDPIERVLQGFSFYRLLKNPNSKGVGQNKSNANEGVQKLRPTVEIQGQTKIQNLLYLKSRDPYLVHLEMNRRFNSGLSLEQENGDEHNEKHENSMLDGDKTMDSIGQNNRTFDQSMITPLMPNSQDQPKSPIRTREALDLPAINVLPPLSKQASEQSDEGNYHLELSSSQRKIRRPRNSLSNLTSAVEAISLTQSRPKPPESTLISPRPSVPVVQTDNKEKDVAKTRLPRKMQKFAPNAEILKDFKLNNRFIIKEIGRAHV